MTTIRIPWRSRARRDSARPRSVPAAPREPATPTHAVSPRVEDLGDWWGVCARRALALLPPELEWAKPLLDPIEPVPLLCSHEQAVRLLRWHSRLPTYAQLSFTAARRWHRDRPPSCA